MTLDVEKEVFLHLFVIKSRNKYRVLTFNRYDDEENPQPLKGYIGEFEELVLLTVAVLGDDAYGVPIKEEIDQRASRTISLGALHSTISRLEEKGYLKSHLGGATHERGGRRKRYFQITPGGKSALREIKSLRDELWRASKINLELTS